MIDEKKIEEIAENCTRKAFNECPFEAISEFKLGAIYGIKEGINWFLDNLWHDASEVPDKRKYIIVEYSTKKVSREAFAPYDVQWLYKDFIGEPWKQLVENEKIIRWLYIDDLLKGGK